MMDLAKEIEKILVGPFKEQGIEIVCVNILHLSTAMNVQVLIERENGDSVSIDDCINCNRLASVLLDVENLIQTRYNLEVSSPGEFRPLTKPSDFKRFAGKLVKVELLAPTNGVRKFRGVIENVEDIDENDVMITFGQIDGVDGTVSSKFSDIKKSTFKKVFEIH